MIFRETSGKNAAENFVRIPRRVFREVYGKKLEKIILRTSKRISGEISVKIILGFFPGELLQDDLNNSGNLEELSEKNIGGSEEIRKEFTEKGSVIISESIPG